MAHECMYCGQECYCDLDDCGGFQQPSDCPHIVRPGACDSDEMRQFDDDRDGSEDNNGRGNWA